MTALDRRRLDKTTRERGLFYNHIPQIHHIISALSNGDLLADAPRQRLLVDREMSHLFLVDGKGLFDHRVALCDVGFAFNLVGQDVEILVAIHTEVKQAFFVFTAAH